MDTYHKIHAALNRADATGWASDSGEDCESYQVFARGKEGNRKDSRAFASFYREADANLASAAGRMMFRLFKILDTGQKDDQFLSYVDSMLSYSSAASGTWTMEKTESGKYALTVQNSTGRHKFITENIDASAEQLDFLAAIPEYLRFLLNEVRKHEYL